MLTLVGRSSSHFTRVARLFAHELNVPYTFKPVLDLSSMNEADYAGNPTLKIPILIDESGSLFGAENICRSLARKSDKRVVMRGEVADRVVANIEEVTLSMMTTEVTVIMARAMKAEPPAKVLRSIENSLSFLDSYVDAAIGALPARDLSFLEVALFCGVTHLPWRGVMEVERWENLGAFCRAFAERPGARATVYKFDV